MDKQISCGVNRIGFVGLNFRRSGQNLQENELVIDPGLLCE